MEDLKLLPIHKHWEYATQCVDVINEEWKGPVTARTRMLKLSCDTLPTSLILLNDDKVIGHSKLITIPSIGNGCFVELVVISKALRGKGYGSRLMAMTEEYCKNTLNLGTVYLATRGQELFYSKLGYDTCDPASIFGSWPINAAKKNTDTDENKGPSSTPPTTNVTKNCPPKEVFMKKSL